MKKILLVNGPNLNMLGVRNSSIYGTQTLDQIVRELELEAQAMGFAISHFQHNCEGELITRVQTARGEFEGLIINAGGYSHTSIALRDALECFDGPIIEVHLSNIAAREAFRHHSYVSQVAKGVIFGLGPSGYRLALLGMKELLA